ncbi:MAG: hypothetical protein RMY28_006725 [Nostoc sp. ChiSLP01]|nr:hypothetical protein [Nostoc sp. CmiSLP01]MDZ8282114.1 hypothetical protein [Nostoc sp. ChiSLP01]
MWQAGITYNTPANRLSLQGTRHHLLNFIPKLEAASSLKRLRIYRTLLKVIVHKAVSDRPGRSEPRVRKPQNLPLDDQTPPRITTAIANCLNHRLFGFSSVPFGYEAYTASSLTCLSLLEGIGS